MTPSPVVSNSSPLIALTQIGRLDLLQSLFGTLWIPPGVALEIAPSVTLPDWMEQRPLTQRVGPLILGASLGLGESEAISLALETNARLLILDDRPARRLAHALQVPMIGTLGILLRAKRLGSLSEVKPCLDALLSYDFHIATALYEQVLRDAGETVENGA